VHSVVSWYYYGNRLVPGPQAGREVKEKKAARSNMVGAPSSSQPHPCCLQGSSIALVLLVPGRGWPVAWEGRGGGAASSSSFPLPRTITGNELARTQGPTGPVMMGDKGSPPSVDPSRSLEDEERSGSQVEAVFCALVNNGQRWPTPVPCPVRVPL
jgi:hypothetical protein